MLWVRDDRVVPGVVVSAGACTGWAHKAFTKKTKPTYGSFTFVPLPNCRQKAAQAKCGQMGPPPNPFPPLPAANQLAGRPAATPPPSTLPAALPNPTLSFPLSPCLCSCLQSCPGKLSIKCATLLISFGMANKMETAMYQL